MTERVEINYWKKLKILGSGGFGQVSLWWNSLTGEKLAIKKLHEEAFKDVGKNIKQLERWHNEVEIMKKLNHVNIVAALKIPPEFEELTSLPLLAMEYCSLGDLRQVLKKGENCCGLKESAVIHILKDVSQGLAYLHSQKIIHRDLKPENIVLQLKDYNTIYKLIDLGYAKAFDQSSLSKSFVGTIQYIAPELFMGKQYTSSVDYWSFGLLTHEIITGQRPFLPDYSPPDWMKRIQNKERNVICVLENSNGNIEFSSNICHKNHMSRYFLKDIEKWLEVALDYNGQTRGRDIHNNRLIIFETLSNIINKKVIKVFSLPTYEILSYEITAETDISDLKIWLQTDTGLDVEEQVLLLHTGNTSDVKGGLLNFLKNEKLDRKNITLFLYNCGRIKLPKRDDSLASFVRSLNESAHKRLTRKQVKKACADSVYFFQSEAIKFECLIQGIKIKVSNIKEKTLAVESLYCEIRDEWNRIENFGQFLYLSHKIDLENYIFYRKTGKLKSSKLVQKWIQNVIEINNKILELKNSYDKNEQRQLVFFAKQRCRNLENYVEIELSQKILFDKVVKKGEKLWEDIQSSLEKNEEKISKTYITIIATMEAFIEDTQKLIHGETLQTSILQISEAEENLTNYSLQLKYLLKSLKTLRLVVENTQQERQKDVWNLIKSQNFTEDEDKGENGIPTTKNDNHVEEEDKGKFGSIAATIAAEDFSPKCDTYESFHDTLAVIDDNNQLRYRIQEAQLNFRQILEEINSLEWDSTLLPIETKPSNFQIL